MSTPYGYGRPILEFNGCNRYSDKVLLKRAQLNAIVKGGLDVEILRSGSALIVEVVKEIEIV